MMPDFRPLQYLFIGLLIFLPFGIWKLIETVVWLFTKVHVSIQ